MTSLVMSFGSSMILSPIRRTAPTSLKQFEASKNPIPAALTASPRTGSTLVWIWHSSKISLAFWTRVKSSALAARSSGFWNKERIYLFKFLNLFIDLWSEHFEWWFSTLVVLDKSLDFIEGWSEWCNEKESEDDGNLHFEFKIWIITKNDLLGFKAINKF